MYGCSNSKKTKNNEENPTLSLLDAIDDMVQPFSSSFLKIVFVEFVVILLLLCMFWFFWPQQDMWEC